MEFLEACLYCSSIHPEGESINSVLKGSFSSKYAPFLHNNGSATICFRHAHKYTVFPWLECALYYIAPSNTRLQMPLVQLN